MEDTIVITLLESDLHQDIRILGAWIAYFCIVYCIREGARRYKLKNPPAHKGTNYVGVIK